MALWVAVRSPLSLQSNAWPPGVADMGANFVWTHGRSVLAALVLAHLEAKSHLEINMKLCICEIDLHVARVGGQQRTSLWSISGVQARNACCKGCRQPLN